MTPSSKLKTDASKYSARQNIHAIKRDETGSAPVACAHHPGQDRDADKYDYRYHHVDDAYLGENKAPRNAANDKCKTDEIYYEGHDVASA